jgi:undecaprenyl diphosphate synthase
VEASGKLGVKVVTLFAFSSENWRRPQQEVGLLMELFITALQRETNSLHKNNVRLKVIGDRAPLAEKLRRHISDAEELTRDNTGLTLVVAANYGGRWDVVQAARQMAASVASGELQADQIDESVFAAHLALHGLPEPDLFIRTGGEQRISNFLLWDLAYTELYFTDLCWPDFDAEALQCAIDSYASRERRFGRTSEQVEQSA